jgi:hypothetical protein
MFMREESTDIVVFRVRRKDSHCSECGEDLSRGGMLRKEGERGLCLDCSELGALVFLPSGDSALTRRAKKYSTLSAVVVEWSRSRKRYERQGLLVEPEALERAEEECLADVDRRERQRIRNADRREVLDERYVASFAAAIRQRYPSAPKDAEQKIAAHACRKYSGRVGRSAAAKELDPEMIDLAVNAYLRHQHTNYEDLLMNGHDRQDARFAVGDRVKELRDQWRTA